MLRLLGLVAIVVAVGAGLVARPAEAGESVDLTGEWILEGLPGTSQKCPTAIAHAGTTIAIAAECVGMQGEGSFEPTTNSFEFATFALSNPFGAGQGTATEDSISMSFEKPLKEPAAVFGSRKQLGVRRNSSATWRGAFGRPSEEHDWYCPLSTRQRDDAIDVDIDCGEQTGSFAGSYDTVSGVFTASGNLFGEDATLHGVITQSTGALAAVWTTASGQGAITARIEQRTGGVVAIDCDGTAAGVQDSCEYDAGEEFLVQVHVVEAPPDGYNGFDFSVHYEIPQLSYRQSELAYEFLETQCATAERGDQWVRPVRPTSTVSYVCFAPAGTDLRLSAGVEVQLTLMCWSPGEAGISVGGGASTILWLGNPSEGLLDTVRPDIFSASVTCNENNHPVGDVDCNGVVNSVDAAVVLQFTSGRRNLTDCEYKGDSTQDGRVDSRDALLILQLDAGLIERLPVL